MEETEVVKKIPNLAVQQWAWLLTLPDSLVSASEKAEVKAKLLTEITDKGTVFRSFLSLV